MPVLQFFITLSAKNHKFVNYKKYGFLNGKIFAVATIKILHEIRNCYWLRSSLPIGDRK